MFWQTCYPPWVERCRSTSAVNLQPYNVIGKCIHILPGLLQYLRSSQTPHKIKKCCGVGFFSLFVYTKAKTKVKAIEQCQTKMSEEGIRFKFTSPIAWLYLSHKIIFCRQLWWFAFWESCASKICSSEFLYRQIL